MPRGHFFSPAGLGFMSAFTFGLVQFLVIALYPMLADATQLSATEVVGAFAFGSLFFIWGAPFWGNLSDRRGRLPILAVGLAGLTFSFAFLLVITQFQLSPRVNLALLILGRVLYGLTACAIVTVAQAWWKDVGSDSRHMISHSLALNLGRVCSPILIWWAASDLTPVLWTLFAVCALLTITAWTGSFNQKNVTLQSTVEEVPFSFSTPLFLALFAGAFIGLMHSTLAIHLQRQFSLDAASSTRLMSKILFVSGVIVVVAQVLLRKTREFAAMTLWWTGLACWTVTAVLFMNLINLPQLWPAIVLLSLGIALVTPAQLALIKSGGQSAGQTAAMQTIGLTSGGALGLVVLENSFPLGLLLFALCLALVMLLQKHSRKECCA